MVSADQVIEGEHITGNVTINRPDGAQLSEARSMSAAFSIHDATGLYVVTGKCIISNSATPSVHCGANWCNSVIARAAR